MIDNSEVNDALKAHYGIKFDYCLTDTGFGYVKYKVRDKKYQLTFRFPKGVDDSKTLAKYMVDNVIMGLEGFSEE